MLNNIVIMGRLTKVPTLRNTQSGKSVSNFTLACDRDIPNADGSRTTDFFDCVAWGKIAENASHLLDKGRKIVVSGRLQINENIRIEDGKKMRYPEIVVTTWDFADSKPAGDQGGQRQQANFTPAPQSVVTPRYAQPAPQYQPQQQTFAELRDDDGDLPF